MVDKPLGRRAYGSIPHLPGSYNVDKDPQTTEGQVQICLTKARKWDKVLVLEKLDGTNVAVARVDGEIVPLIRAGYRAVDAHYPMHHMFHRWVMERKHQFGWLREGERISGEWLAQAHGTLYDLTHCEPFVAFDIFGKDNHRWQWWHIRETCFDNDIQTARLLVEGPTGIEDALAALDEKGIPVLDGEQREGVVYRVETLPVAGKISGVNFLAKYVRPGRVVGKYLPGCAGRSNDAEPIWNWKEQPKP